MENIEIVRGRKNGEGFFLAKLNEKNESLLEISRAVTKTRYESGNGIFTESLFQTFKYGDLEKTFEFGPLVLLGTRREDLVKELTERIKMVREWVKTIDYEETFTISI